MFYSSLITFVFNFFVVMLLQQYCLRAMSSMHRQLVLKDYFCVYCFSICYAILLSFSSTSLHILVFILAMLQFTLQWVNIIALRYFGIKVNAHMLRTAMTGVGGLTDEMSAIIPELLRDLKLLTLFLLTLYTLFGLIFLDKIFFISGLIANFVLFLTIVTKSKISQQTVLYWIVGLIIFEVIFLWLFKQWPAVYTTGATTIAIGVVTLTLLLLAFLSVLKKEKAFFSLPALLLEQFKDEKINPAVLQQAPPLDSADQDLAELKVAPAVVTQATKTCDKASVILITMESLTDYYFDATKRQEFLPFLSSLEKQGLSSQHHISPSALTNNALRAIYAGVYSHQTDFPHLQLLKDLGYQTCFLTSQKTNEFNLDKILNKIGFEHVIDNTSISGNKLQRLSDPNFFPQAYQELESKVDFTEPFFLHLMNNQTHGPYFTYEKNIPHRQQRYFQALKEADENFADIVQKIKQVNDNIIIVYTGDHGESFGEEGYVSHANSVIQPQIQVPLVIQHPKLTATECDFSSHFDLLPTIFDLLGKQYDYEVCGASLFNQVRNKQCFAYSETRMGNTPSSFCLITPDKKLYFDRHLGNYQIRSLDDTVIENLTGERYQYYLKLLFLSLQERQLIL